MRVQPHLPSRPLLATVMSRSGLALSACSAANRPAPPESRIRMSVLRCSTFMRPSEHTREEDKGDDCGCRGGQRRKLFLAVVPGEIFHHQQSQATEWL